MKFFRPGQLVKFGVDKGTVCFYDTQVCAYFRFVDDLPACFLVVDSSDRFTEKAPQGKPDFVCTVFLDGKLRMVCWNDLVEVAS